MNRLLGIFKKGNLPDIPQSPTSPTVSGPGQGDSFFPTSHVIHDIPVTPSPLHRHSHEQSSTPTTTAIDSRNLKELDSYLWKVLKHHPSSSLSRKQSGTGLKARVRERIDIQSLQKVLCPVLLSEKLLEKIFMVYSHSQADQTVEIRQFFAGLSACCGGTTDDKLLYCFSLYDDDEDQSLSRGELLAMLESLYKIADIHRRLIKSESTLLTLSRVPNRLAAPMTTNAAEDRGSSDVRVSVDSVQSIDINENELKKGGFSRENTLRSDMAIRSESIPALEVDLADNKTESHVSVATGADSLSVFTFKSKRPSVKGLPIFDALNKNLKTSFASKVDRLAEDRSEVYGHMRSKTDTSTVASTVNSDIKKSFDDLGSGGSLNENGSLAAVRSIRKVNEAVSSADELTNILYSSLDIDDDSKVSINDYVRWIHKNPKAMQFLDKVKHIASNSPKQSHLAEEEREIITASQSSWRPSYGEEAFVISSKWWRLWVSYVDFNRVTDIVSNVSHQSAAAKDAPGSIDNFDLLKQDELSSILEFPMMQENLLDVIDYTIVSKNTWNTLISWYGGGPAIARQVVSSDSQQEPSQSMSVNNLKVANSVELDLYPLLLWAGTYKDRKVYCRCICSSQLFIEDLRHLICNQLNVNYSPNLKLWAAYENNEPIQLDDDGATVNEMGVTMAYKIFIDAKIRHDRSLTVATVSSWFKGSNAVSPMTPNPPMTPVTAYPVHDPIGHVGLANLGNTCFLNAALQAILHTVPLMEYFKDERFVAEKRSGRSDGVLTDEFVKLIETYWSSKNYSHVAPQALRQALIKRSPQFGGVDQHDSQEVLGLILDFLHIDLNIIDDKKCAENPDFNGQGDEYLSTIYWKNHIMRDASLIVSLFEGQFKSHAQCLECKHEIVKFDPFMFLSVPLPTSHNRTMNFVYVPAKGGPIQLGLKLEKDDSVLNILEAVKATLKLDENGSFFVADVQGSYIFSFLNSNNLVSEIRDRDTIYIYEDFNEPKSESTSRIILLHRQFKDEWTLSGRRTKTTLYGIPLILHIVNAEADALTGHDIYQQIQDRLTTNYPALESIMTDIKGAAAAPKDPSTLNPTSPRLPKSPKDTPAFAFSLKFVKRNGSTCSRCTDIRASNLACTGCTVDCSDNLIELEDDEAMVIEWNTKAKRHIQELSKLFSDTQEHSSVKLVGSPSAQSTDLEDIISEYEKVEWMSKDDFYCPKCKGFQEGIKRETIWKMPPILMVQLKRFAYTPHGCVKNDSVVRYPLVKLNMAPFMTPNVELGREKLVELLPQISRDNSHRPFPLDKKRSGEHYYDLYASICHLGSFYEGHYLTYAKDGLNQDDKWFIYNDELVKELQIQEQYGQSNTAYVLFYKSRDMPAVSDLWQSLKDQVRDLQNQERIEKSEKLS